MTATGETGDTTVVTVGGIPYDVTIKEQCNHEGHQKRVEGSKAATCTETGLTGNQYCSNCNELLEASHVTQALGHNWSDWENVTQASWTDDGTRMRSCRRNGCDETDTETVMTAEQFASGKLAEAIESAETKVTQTNVYTPESLAAL